MDQQSGNQRTYSGRPAVRRLVDHWVVIVLTVISIIQGVAVGRLADAFGDLQSVSRWSAFALSFIVVLRVFQTYVAAALEYDEWRVEPQSR